jgi:hypothetical protein
LGKVGSLAASFDGKEWSSTILSLSRLQSSALMFRCCVCGIYGASRASSPLLSYRYHSIGPWDNNSAWCLVLSGAGAGVTEYHT